MLHSEFSFLTAKFIIQIQHPQQALKTNIIARQCPRLTGQNLIYPYTRKSARHLIRILLRFDAIYTFNILPIEASRKSGKDNKRNVWPWQHKRKMTCSSMSARYEKERKQLPARGKGVNHTVGAVSKMIRVNLLYSGACIN